MDYLRKICTYLREHNLSEKDTKKLEIYESYIKS